MDMDHFNGLLGHEGMYYDAPGLSDLERKALKHDNLGEEFFRKSNEFERKENEHASATLKAWSNFESYA